MTGRPSACTHDWSPWTSWLYYGSGQDIREKFCRRDGCTEGDCEYRSHVHSYKRYPDPYAPIGSGLTMQVCETCHNPK